MTKITYIPGEIANAAIDEHGNRKPVTRTQHIFDDTKGKSQAEVNADIDDSLNQLSDEIDAVNKQDIIPVDTLPAVATADSKKIYRVVGEDSYTDCMVNASGDGWKTLATYSFPGIDDEPTANSNNLVESGGVSSITDIIGKNTITSLNSGYIYFSNGSIGGIGHQIYRYSNNIEVQEGQVYAICCKNGGDTPAAIAAYDSNGVYIQEKSVNFDDYPELKRFLYIVPEGVHHIIVSGQITYTISAIKLSNDILSDFFVLDNIKLLRNPYGIYSSNGTPYTNASAVSSSYDIEVSKGDVFFIKAGCYASTCVIAAYDASDNYIADSSVIGKEQSISIDYIVPNGVSKIIISNNSGLEASPVIIKKHPMLSYYDYSLIDLSLRIDNTLPKIPITIPNLNTGWIALSDGSINAGATYRYSDPILVNEGDIFWYNGGVSSSVAVVAMYTSTSATSNDYVQLSSIAGTGGANNIEFTIPHGIVAIRLCNNTTLISLENLLLYKRNPLYSDFITKDDVKQKVIKGSKKPVSGYAVYNFITQNISYNLVKRKSVVSFIFDDNHAADANMKRYCDDKGIKCGFAIISMSDRYIDYYNEGFSILAHGDLPSGGWNETNLRSLINTDLTMMSNAGIVCKGWVTPSSELPIELRPVVYDYFEYGYTIYKGADTQNVYMPYSSKSYALWRSNMDTLTEAECKAIIDEGVTNNAMICFYSHTNITEAKFKAIIDYALAHSQVMAPDDAINYFFTARHNEDLT